MPSAAASPGIVATLRAGFADGWRWLAVRERRALAGFVVLFLLANTGYSVYRAMYLRSCDLVTGFLNPTRGVLFDGKDIYRDFGFNSYSPFFYVVMAPLAPLPNGVASLLWTVLSIALFLGILVFIRAILKTTAPAQPAGRFWLAPALIAFLFANNLHLGQSNLFAFFFVCAALYAFTVGADARAGLLLAVAIAYKITPGLFLLHWLIRGRWRALLWTGVGLALWIAVVPALVFGPDRNRGFLTDWTRMVVAPVLSGERPRTANVDWYHTNQSLDAFLQRQLTPYAKDRYGGLHRWVDVPVLTSAAASKLGLALKGLVLGVVAWLALRGRRSGNRSLPVEWSVLTIATLFLSPLSWVSHYVVLVLPFAVAAWHAHRGRRFLWAALAAAALPTFVALTPQPQSYSPYFLGAAALFVALAVHGVTVTRSPATSGAGAPAPPAGG